LADDAQHCSEQFRLFEIAHTALIVKPEHLELSISGMAVQESRVRSKLWYSCSHALHRTNLTPGWDILACN
jgi:hypothetical protein